MDTGEPSCHPVVQGKNDPTPGYYVSMTSLYDASITSERDPAACGCSEYPVRGAPPKGFNHAQPEDLPPWSICKMAIRPARAIVAGPKRTRPADGRQALAAALEILGGYAWFRGLR